MELEHLGHLPLNRQVRVKRGHGVLENHRHAVAANTVQVLGWHADQVLPLVQHLACGPSVNGEQAHHGQHGLTLARAAFAHNAQCLAAVQREVDSIDGADHAVGRLELHAQLFDFQ